MAASGSCWLCTRGARPAGEGPNRTGSAGTPGLQNQTGWRKPKLLSISEPKPDMRSLCALSSAWRQGLSFYSGLSCVCPELNQDQKLLLRSYG